MRKKRLFTPLMLLGVLVWPLASQATPTSFTWVARPMQSGEIANIVVSPTNPNVMYLGVEVNAHSVYKSEDGGRSWRRIDNGDHAKDVAIHPKNPDIAFYADSQSLWRTLTGGQETAVEGSCDPRRQKCAETFQKVIDNRHNAGPSQTSFSSIAIAPSNPDVVYATIRGGSGGGPFGGGKGGQLYRSTDGGASFTELAGDYPSFLTLFVHSQKPDELWVGSESGLYHSIDGGQTLTKAATNRDITSFDSLDGKTIFAAQSTGSGGVLRSTDGGANWKAVTTGLPDPAVLRVRIVRDQPQAVWATTRKGVARSEDGGQTWQNVTGNLPATNVKALAVDPTNPHVAIVATETYNFDVQHPDFYERGQYYHQGIYRTENGGQTWQRSDAGLLEERVIELTAHPTRPDEVWGAEQSSRGSYRSLDGGQTWSVSPSLLTHYPMRFAFFPDSTDKLAHTSLHTGEDFGITENDGVSWKMLSEQTFFKSLAARGQELFDSSKTANSNLHLHGLAIDPQNPNTIYVGSVHDTAPFNQKPLSGAHIFKSTDGGATWIESDEGFEHSAQTAIHDIEIDPSLTSTLYVATTRDESQVGNGIWKSVDSGTTWQRTNTGLPDNVSAEVIIVHPTNSGQLLVGTMQGLYQSTDGAATWHRVRSEDIWDIEFDPTDPDTVYTGGSLGLWQSTDFGKNWTNVSTNLPKGKVRALAVNSTGQIVYASIEGSGVYVAVDPSLGDIPLDGGVTKTSGHTYGSGDQILHPLSGHSASQLATKFTQNSGTYLALIAISAVGGLLLILIIVLIFARRHAKIKV